MLQCSQHSAYNLRSSTFQQASAIKTFAAAAALLLHTHTAGSCKDTPVLLSSSSGRKCAAHNLHTPFACKGQHTLLITSPARGMACFFCLLLRVLPA
jgi:hypothetical protein